MTGAAARACVCAVALASLSNCLAPTEITVWLSTDVACSDVDVNGVAVGVDTEGTDPAANAAVSYGCSPDGGLGSLVITPSGGIDGRVGIRVTLGVDASVENCTQYPYTGCIVARRELPYSPHEPLTLPIGLESDCLGNPCLDPNQTCFAGSCVDAGVVCNGGVCDLPEAGVEAGAPVACVPTSLQAISVQTTNGALRPRIARAGSGYAVAYALSTGGVVGSFLTVAPDGGVTVGAPSEVALVPSTTVVNSLGPLASNGSDFVLSYGSGTNYEIVSVDTTGKVLATGSRPNAGPASQGLILASSNVYVTADYSGAAGIELLAWNPTTLAPTITPVGAIGTAITQVAVGGSGSTYYVATYDSSLHWCKSFTCTLQGGNSFNCSLPSIGQNACAGTVIEASGSFYAFAVDVGGSMQAQTSTGSGLINAGQVAAPPFAMVATKNDTLRLVWQRLTEIGSAPISSMTPAVITPSPDIPNQSGESFDVAAFDPINSLGYAVVIASTAVPSTVLFQQFCP